MNRFQKALWVLVLVATAATSIAGVVALATARGPLPSMGDAGRNSPPELAGYTWIAQVTEAGCDRACGRARLAMHRLGERLSTEADLALVTLELQGSDAGSEHPGRIVIDARRGWRVSGAAAGAAVEGLHALAGPPPPDPASTEIVLKNYGDLGPWSLTAEDGRKFGSDDLAARVWIADFIFTNCAGPCPLMCDAMKTLVKRLPDVPGLKFVSFSVDPRRDTPQALLEFSKKWDAPERWKFVTGDGVYNLAYDGFKLEARPAPKPEPGAEFIHSQRFTLVDGRGRMRGVYVYDYENPETIEPLLKSIVRDTRALLETPERIVDHEHDARFFLVDRGGQLRGVFPASETEALIRDARRLSRSPEKLMSVRTLPRLNAALNGASFVFLALGLAFILNRKVTPHKACMTAALVTSALFLVSYLAYHFQAGSVKYAGEGLMRTAYFGVLVSHTILAALVAPLAIVTVVRAWKGAFDRHKALARWTLPVWMYVSLTGILVYLMLYQIA